MSSKPVTSSNLACHEMNHKSNPKARKKFFTVRAPSLSVNKKRTTAKAVDVHKEKTSSTELLNLAGKAQPKLILGSVNR